VKLFEDRVAAITGAGSGIGRALAVNLASRGAHLALSDIDEAGLAETVTMCEGHGVKVTSQRLDVADRDAIYAWADQVVADHERVNFIFNNAGVALAANIATMSDEDMHWLIDINLWGVINGTRAFLPHLEASGEGHVVNLSSVFGLISVPSQSAYNVAKFGVRGFTDTLRMELAIAGSSVSATTVHPGGVKTDIARSARVSGDVASLVGGDEDKARDGFDRIARTTADQAAKDILAAVERDRRRVVVGLDGKIVDLLSRLPAVVVQGMMVNVAKLGQRFSQRS